MSVEIQLRYIERDGVVDVQFDYVDNDVGADDAQIVKEVTEALKAVLSKYIKQAAQGA